jgi:hypothetical protein
MYSRFFSVLVVMTCCAVLPAPSNAAPDQPTVERPDALTVGVGIGSSLEPWVLSHSVVAIPIDRGGLRLRITDRLTLAPGFVHSRVARDHEGDADGSASSFALSRQELQASVRWVAGSRGPMDLVVLGGADVGRSLLESDKGNSGTGPFYETWLGMRGGLGIEAFVRPQWSVGLDAEMNLYTSDRYKGANSEQRDTQLSLGWAPGVVASTYLYF